jgi:addiction module HigA family antidote
MPDFEPRPLHPGEALNEDFLNVLGISPNKLAKITGIPVVHIEALIDEEEDFSVDDAVRIATALNTSPDFWLDLQTSYTRWILEHGDAVAN